MFLTMWQLWSTVILLQCQLQGWCVFSLGENSKEPSSTTISTEASFNDDSNDKNLTVNKVCQQ